MLRSTAVRISLLLVTLGLTVSASAQSQPSSSRRNLAAKPTIHAELRPEPQSDGVVVPTEKSSFKDIRFDSNVPSLRVSTVGPDTLVVGKPATYVISLLNMSDFEAQDVVVRCSLPGWVQLRSHKVTSGKLEVTRPKFEWHVDTVEAHGQQNLSLVLVPRSGTAFELNVDIAIQPTKSRTRIAVQEPMLDLQLAGPTDIVYGDVNRWKLVVANRGTGDANDVSLDVYSGATQLTTQRLGTVPAGSTRRLTLDLRAKEVGTHPLQAIVTGSLGLKDIEESRFLVRRGALHVDMVGPELEYAGTTSEYTITVTNTGNATAKNVAVVVDTPAGVTYRGGVADASLISEGVGWNIASIDVDQSLTFSVMADLESGGNHELTATASTVDELVSTASAVTETLTAADLKLDVVDPKGPRPLGSISEYEIHVTNHGTDVAYDITLLAVCAPELEPVEVTGNAAVKSGQIFFKPILSLEPGHKVIHRVTVRATEAGSHGFKVMVRCEDPVLRLATEETTRFFVRSPSRASAVITKRNPTQQR